MAALTLPILSNIYGSRACTFEGNGELRHSQKSYSINTSIALTSHRTLSKGLSLGAKTGNFCRWRKQLYTSVKATATTSTPVSTSTTDGESQRTVNGESKEDVLACPICHQPLVRIGPKGLNRRAVAQSGFKCEGCRRAFSSREGFLDLTITGSTKQYKEQGPGGVETFRNPWVSYVYERGWRQSFARAGFPGADEEVLPSRLPALALLVILLRIWSHRHFRMAQEYLEPARGGVLLDASCGSGLFARRFAKSGRYGAVVASDLSETMLRQATEFVARDSALDDANVALVRADVARLPFRSGSVDGVHAGAALHCWPSPALAVAEISRVLRPGGVFVATTFLNPQAPLGSRLLKPVQQALLGNQGRTGWMKYWEPAELEELCKACGLALYTADVRQDFIMLAATKPS
eukprot:jgi/Mesen1/1988/ME000147S01077